VTLNSFWSIVHTYLFMKICCKFCYIWTQLSGYSEQWLTLHLHYTPATGINLSYSLSLNVCKYPTDVVELCSSQLSRLIICKQISSAHKYKGYRPSSVEWIHGQMDRISAGMSHGKLQTTALKLHTENTHTHTHIQLTAILNFNTVQRTQPKEQLNARAAPATAATTNNNNNILAYQYVKKTSSEAPKTPLPVTTFGFSLTGLLFWS